MTEYELTAEAESEAIVFELAAAAEQAAERHLERRGAYAQRILRDLAGRTDVEQVPSCRGGAAWINC